MPITEITWPVGKDPTPKMIAAMRREVGTKNVRAWLSDREVACMFKAAISTAAIAAGKPRKAVAHTYHSRIKDGACTDCGQPKSEHP